MTEFIISGVSFLVTAATTIIAAIKGKKSKTKTKEAKKQIEEKNKLVKLAKIAQKIPCFISEAEEALGTGTGKAKLRYVLRELEIECLKANIEFQEEDLKVEIERILETPQKKQKIKYGLPIDPYENYKPIVEEYNETSKNEE